MSTGNIKYDFDIVKNLCGLEHLFKRKKFDENILLLGSSTWPGEELVLGRIYKQLKVKYPNLMLVVAPRHVERARDIEKEFSELGLQVCRRTSARSLNADSVMLLDTTGELSGLYADADIVFVGKSLFDGGGQNPIEPAAYGCALITGPNMGNFKVESEILDAACARAVIENEQELMVQVDTLISNEKKRLLLSRAAEDVYLAGRGATGKTVSLLENIRVGSYR